MLNREETPQRVKDVENFLSDESHSKKKEVKNNTWNVSDKIHVQK